MACRSCRTRSGRILFFAAFVLLAVAFCAAYFGPFGPTGQPDPTIIQTVPKPDYFFLWLYALLALLPPSMETPVLLIGPVVVIGGLLLLAVYIRRRRKKLAPPAHRRAHRAAHRRRARLASRISPDTRPWSPQMNAWSGEPIPENSCTARTALERQGALVFQVKQCRNCHALGGEGGQRGPALDTVAMRLTQDQLIRQVIQGGGNMPAYGKA